MDTSLTLSTPNVCDVAGASYRQLDYWARIGLLVPDTPARGSGSQRRYTLRQAMAARAVVVICEARGGHVHRLAPLVDYLSALDEWRGAVVVGEAGVQSVDEWVATSCREAGTILDLAAIAASVELAIAELDARGSRARRRSFV